jgi:hypothetical protein
MAFGFTVVSLLDRKHFGPVPLAAIIGFATGLAIDAIVKRRRHKAE